MIASSEACSINAQANKAILLQLSNCAKDIMSRCFYFFSLLLAVVSSNALANDPPQLDIEQRNMARVGELFSLNIAPTDSSGMVPGVYLVNPPDGSTFSDQGDGTRAFQWIPPAFGSEEKNPRVWW